MRRVDGGERVRRALVALSLLVVPVAPVLAQVSFGIAVPGVSIGINLPVYPQLVAVPGYPVYYAPQVNSNYFFYDGAYWIYQRDNWYASSWYNGPWALVAPDAVPLYVLRVPVRYYRQPPTYFYGWRSDAAPRWDEHWGHTWSQSHGGWDRWNRASSPSPAPLPVYQRQYTGSRYPQPEQQSALQSQNYRYRPHEAVVQQHYETQRVQSGATFAAPQEPRGGNRPPSAQMSAAPPQRAPAAQTGSMNGGRPANAQGPQQQQQQQIVPTVQRAPSPSQPVQRETRTSAPPGQTQKPAGKPAQQQAQPPGQGPPTPQAAAHRPPESHQDRGPQDKPPQGKGPPQDARQGHENGDPRGAERSK